MRNVKQFISGDHVQFYYKKISNRAPGRGLDNLRPKDIDPDYAKASEIHRIARNKKTLGIRPISVVPQLYTEIWNHSQRKIWEGKQLCNTRADGWS